MEGQTVKIFLQYKLNTYEINAPVTTTFGNLKDVAERSTGIPSSQLKLLFRGREKLDTELLMAAGVKHGSRIQVAETSQYRDSQPDVTAAFHQNHTAAANGQGQPSYAQSSTIGGHAAAEAFASSGAHNNRAPDSWEQFSSSGPTQAQAFSQYGRPGQPAAAQSHAYAHTSTPAHQQSPHAQPTAQHPSPRQSHFDATPHTSPRPSPPPSTGANGSLTASVPGALPPEEAAMQKIVSAGRAVDELGAKAEALLQQPVLDRKSLRAIEEQFTQQLLALDQLEVAAEARVARKVQINRINHWADRLEAVRSNQG